MGELEDFVVCRICGGKFRQITHSHLKRHGMTFAEYQNKFPKAPMISGKTQKIRSENNPAKRLDVRAKISASHIGKTLTREHRAKMSAAQIELWKDPEHRAKMSAARIGRVLTEETKTKISVAHIERCKDPKVRARMSAAATGRILTEETKAKHSEFMKEYWKDPENIAKHKEIMNRPEIKAKFSGENNPSKQPEVRAKISAALTGHSMAKETKAKISASAIERYKDPEYRAKLSGENAPMYGRTGENSSNWKDGRSFLPYCPNFTRALKEQVRNRYGRICVNCGKGEIENGERLCVHHIDGNKMQGCDGHDWFLVPLCKSCNSKQLEDSPFHIVLFGLKQWELQEQKAINKAAILFTEKQIGLSDFVSI